MDTKKLRQKILDLAIRGKLVPQDPNDEPASVLLERIKAEKGRLIKEGKIKKSKKSVKTSDTPHYENVPFEVPESWVWCKFQDCMDVRDGTHDSPKYTQEGYPLITSKDFKNGQFDFSKTRYISEVDYKNIIKRSKVDIGDILYSMIGGNIGSMIYIQHDNYFDMAIKNVALFKPYQNSDISTKYIAYFLESKIKEYQAIAIGGAQPFVGLDIFRNTLVPLPPLAEQHRIITEIEKWFALIDQIEQGKVDLQTIIKQTKSKILDFAIHGKLVPQDPNDEPAIKLLKRINPDFTPCDNGHYPQLPERWCAVTLKDLCENINGLWKGKKEPFVNVGVIRNANFTKDFKLDYSNIEYIDVEQRTFTKRHLENGDLIVEKSGGSDNNPVGRTILYEGKSGVFSFSNFTMVLRIRNSDIVLGKFLYYYILAKYQKGDMRLMQTQTTGLRNLILDKFLSMPIHLPPASEQKRIINKIETIFTSLDMIMGSL